MLLEFTVGNYLSFKDKMTFSMLPDTALSRTVDGQVIEVGGEQSLSGAIIYGANASGKTNLLTGFAFFRWFVRFSHQSSAPAGGIGVRPFMLNHETEHSPSYFEVQFLHKGTKYRYGFELDHERVHREWLHQDSTRKREATLFERKNQNITVGAKFGEGKGLEGRVTPNKLFLSVAAQFNGEIAVEIVSNWFGKRFRVTSTLKGESYENYTAKMMQIQSTRKLINEIICQLDIGLEEVSANYKESDVSELPESIRQLIDLGKVQVEPGFYEIKTIHKDDEGKNIDFDFSFESAGTRRLFELLGPIVETLINGYTLVIDEFDNRLHPMLAYKLIRLFNSVIANRSGAQLIIASHNTNLIDQTLFGRDQIWFTAKNERGITDLYSLADYKQPHTERKDARFDKRYLKGRYGAVPIMGDIEEIIGKYLEVENADG